MIKILVSFITGVVVGIILMCLLQINKRGEEDEI